MSTNMSYASHPTTPSLLHLIKARIGTAVASWIGLTVVIFAVTLANAHWGEVRSSIWQEAGALVPLLFGLPVGISIGHKMLPLYIANGQTRREFCTQAIVFVLAYSAILAVLVALGFALEGVLYGIGGWTQTVNGGHLYSSPEQFHLIFVESWLATTLWTAGGIFIGAAFYRGSVFGTISIIAGIVILGIAGISVGSDWGPMGKIAERLTGETDIVPLIGIPMYVGCIVLVAALAWAVIRDIPLRNKAA